MRKQLLTGTVSLALLVSMQVSIVWGDKPALNTATNQTLSVEELAKLKQNPVSGMRQISIQDTVSPNLAGSGKTGNTFSIQPIWPFPLNDDWRVISYTILPYIQQPAVNGASAKHGLGDTLINLFVAPRNPGVLVWGAGPAIVLPTRTDPALGSDRVGLGPAVVLYYAKGAWSAGVLPQNGWSLGGSGINQINAFGAQYLLSYNLPKGWFLQSNATITANWLADAPDRWTVPVGGGFGKVFNIGKQSVGLSFQAFYNVIAPDNAPGWTGTFQVSFLFP